MPASPLLLALPPLLLQLARSAASAAAAGSEVHDVDVVIIGAGAAGIAAAASLLSRNVTEIAVLEARNYTGGRIHSVRFGSAPAVTIEEGANWEHGYGNMPTTNPIAVLADKANLSAVRVPGSCANVTGYALFDERGAPVPDSTARSEAANKALDCLNRTAAEIGPAVDMTFSEALHRCGWAPRDAVDEAMLWEITAADAILPPWKTSLKGSLPDATYQVFGQDDRFVFDQRGYSVVLEQLLPRRVLAPKLWLSSPVARVGRKQGCAGVAVQTEDGGSWCAKQVISTIPLGAMQRHHARIFQQPRLPRAQAAALEGLTMGNFTKIFAQFPRKFWGARGLQWLAALPPRRGGRSSSSSSSSSGDKGGPGGDPEFGGGPIEFHDLDALIPGSRTLFTYVVGADSAVWEGMTDAAAQRALLQRLREQFGHEAVPEISAFHMTRHGSDELMLGAYSAARVPFSQERMLQVITPLSVSGRSSVYFAGEAVCQAYTGYAHGAIFSGQRAAHQVLTAMRVTSQGVYGGECESRALPPPQHEQGPDRVPVYA